MKCLRKLTQSLTLSQFPHLKHVLQVLQNLELTNEKFLL
jgi:hypothetical protein